MSESAGPKLNAKFGRSQKLVIAGRFLVLLILNQAPQGRFLLRAALQHQHHAMQDEIGRRFSLIVLGASQRMNVARQTVRTELSIGWVISAGAAG